MYFREKNMRKVERLYGKTFSIVVSLKRAN